MTWRLWYRQAIMNKKPVVSSPAISEPTSQELAPVVSKPPTKTLSRSRSSPTLSAQCSETAKQSSPPLSSPPPSSSSTSATNKFFISDSEDEEDDDDYDYDYDQEATTTDDDEISISDYPLTPAATSDDAGLFIKQEIPPCQPVGSRTSMLAVMLNQQQQQERDSTISTSPKATSGLRRCDARIERLDQWFTSTRA